MLARHGATAKTATIVKRGLSYGLARMYELTHANADFKLGIFSDKNPAEEWLEIQSTSDPVKGYKDSSST